MLKQKPEIIKCNEKINTKYVTAMTTCANITEMETFEELFKKIEKNNTHTS